MCVCVCLCLCLCVAQLCPTLCDAMDCSPLGSSLHGILQARILAWLAIPFSRGSSQPRDWTQVWIESAGRYFFFFFFFILTPCYLFIYLFISWRLITFQYCSGFCHTLTWISHGFTCVPHPDPPPTSLSTRSLWVFPVHQARALVSCLQPGLVICFTLDNIHVSMLFSWNIPPSPSPTESKSLFCTSVSLFLFCRQILYTWAPRKAPTIP